MVPRTTQLIADEDPIAERRPVVGARAADGEHLPAPPREHDRRAARVSDRDRPFGEVGRDKPFLY
jgi:hypothetical protein